MTKQTPTTNTGRWESAMQNFVAAKEAAESITHLADCDAIDRIYDLLDEVEQSVLSTTAPHLGAVAEKLEILWSEELFDEADPVASYKRKVIGDIRRINLLNLGVDNEEASGGMDLQGIAADWAEAVQQYERHAKSVR